MIVFLTQWIHGSELADSWVVLTCSIIIEVKSVHRVVFHAVVLELLLTLTCADTGHASIRVVVRVLQDGTIPLSYLPQKEMTRNNGIPSPWERVGARFFLPSVSCIYMLCDASSFIFSYYSIHRKYIVQLVWERMAG